MDPQTKPLNIKAYHSIGHLIGSNTGTKDRTVSIGQHKLATEYASDPAILTIAQEKIDGSCVAIAKKDNQIIALGRAGYLASHSQFEHIRMFARYVRENENRFKDVLEEGERLVGESLFMVTGTRYLIKDVHDAFVPFDILRGFAPRASNLEMCERIYNKGFRMPAVLNIGQGMSIPYILASLGEFGHMGAQDPVEGFVIRVEKNANTQFLVKYIKPGFEPGRYLSQVSGKEPIWNWKL